MGVALQPLRSWWHTPSKIDLALSVYDWWHIYKTDPISQYEFANRFNATDAKFRLIRRQMREQGYPYRTTMDDTTKLERYSLTYAARQKADRLLDARQAVRLSMARRVVARDRLHQFTSSAPELCADCANRKSRCRESPVCLRRECMLCETPLGAETAAYVLGQRQFVCPGCVEEAAANN